MELTLKIRIYLVCLTLLATRALAAAQQPALPVIQSALKEDLMELKAHKFLKAAVAKANEILTVYGRQCPDFDYNEIPELGPKFQFLDAKQSPLIREPLDKLVAGWQQMSCRSTIEQPGSGAVAATRGNRCGAPNHRQQECGPPGRQEWKTVDSFKAEAVGLAADDRFVLASALNQGIWVSTDHGERFEPATMGGGNEQAHAIFKGTFPAFTFSGGQAFACAVKKVADWRQFYTGSFEQYSRQVSWHAEENIPFPAGNTSAMAFSNGVVFIATSYGVVARGLNSNYPSSFIGPERYVLKHLVANDSHVIGDQMQIPFRRDEPQDSKERLTERKWEQFFPGLEHSTHPIQVTALTAGGGEIYMGDSAGKVYRLRQGPGPEVWEELPGKLLAGGVVAIAVSTGAVFAADRWSVYRARSDAPTNIPVTLEKPLGVWSLYNSKEAETSQIAGLAVSGDRLIAARHDGIHTTSVNPSKVIATGAKSATTAIK